MSFAKREPGAAQALAAAGPGPGRRVLSWLGLATGESGGRRR
jgi:cell division protein FtsW